jgi:mxaA protein
MTERSRIGLRARAALAAACLVAAADAAAVGIEVVTPRATGYVIGDTITHVARVDLEGGYRLDEAALPAAGRVDRWLELREPVLVRHARGVDVALTYQVVNAPERTRELAVPTQTLRVAGPRGSLPLFVPEWTFVLAPLVPAEQRGAVALHHLRSERPPPAPDLGPDLWRLAALGAGLLLVLGRLAWLRWGAPWRARRAQPFAQALRSLERMRRQPWDDARRAEAFRIVHGALDRAAGCTLLPSNVDALFRARPALARLRAPIERTLVQSRDLFFGTRGPEPAPALAALVALCRACRDAERSGVTS